MFSPFLIFFLPTLPGEEKHSKNLLAGLFLATHFSSPTRLCTNSLHYIYHQASLICHSVVELTSCNWQKCRRLYPIYQEPYSSHCLRGVMDPDLLFLASCLGDLHILVLFNVEEVGATTTSRGFKTYHSRKCKMA